MIAGANIRRRFFLTKSSSKNWRRGFAFEEKLLLILFRPETTEELKATCVIHEIDEQVKNAFKVETRINLQRPTYTVTQIGSAAN